MSKIDDLTHDHLRALLAEQTTRAERAERTLTEALTRLPSTWGPPEVLRHLLDKAGRCDQAEVRAEHAERENEKLAKRLEGCMERGTVEEARAEKAEAERDAALAACAELRAACERFMGGCKCETCEAIRTRLSRPDLGRGMVVVEREVLERVRGAVELLLRHRAHRTSCAKCDPAREALADLDALLKKGGG